MIIRPEKLEDVKEILDKMNIKGMTVSAVQGCGHQKGVKETYRGTPIVINLLQKVMVVTVVKDDIVDELIKNVVARVSTGKIGDGKIFVSNIENAVRIRTGESGEIVL